MMFSKVIVCRALSSISQAYTGSPESEVAGNAQPGNTACPSMLPVKSHCGEELAYGLIQRA